MEKDFLHSLKLLFSFEKKQLNLRFFSWDYGVMYLHRCNRTRLIAEDTSRDATPKSCLFLLIALISMIFFQLVTSWNNF